MKITGLVTIETGSTDSAKAEAFKADVANVYVTTENPQTAPELLRKGISDALDAMRDWPTQEEEPATDDYFAERCVEFKTTDSDQGTRFYKSIVKAEDFTRTHDKSGGLTIDQLQYIASLSQISIWYTIDAVYNIAYRRGYNRAKTDTKAKKAAKN